MPRSVQDNEIVLLLSQSRLNSASVSPVSSLSRLAFKRIVSSRRSVELRARLYSFHSSNILSV
jgi:hypothetical protein